MRDGTSTRNAAARPHPTADAGGLSSSRRLRLLAPALGLALLAALPASASARIFGTNPIPISVGPNGEPANGPSGGAEVSGDNRNTRWVAFHSVASNLVGGDSNGASDVFVWTRPRGGAGLSLGQPARPSGGLLRVSVSSSGAQANGPSQNPSVDGSIRRGPRCVAFESRASNLASGDSDKTADIFVRYVASKRTVLVSRGVRGAATNPSIDGSCRRVAFQSSGRIMVAPVRSGRVRTIGRGSSPDVSLDGTATVWQRGGGIRINRLGRTSTVTSNGRNAAVSNRTTGRWGVSFQTSARLTGNDNNGGVDVYSLVVGSRGGGRSPDLISAGRKGEPSLGGSNTSGDLTAYAAARGFVMFVHNGSTLYYRNNNTGNIDDLALANGSISDVSQSARGNFVAFTSNATNFPFDGNGGTADVFFKHLRDGTPL